MFAYTSAYLCASSSRQISASAWGKLREFDVLCVRLWAKVDSGVAIIRTLEYKNAVVVFFKQTWANLGRVSVPRGRQELYFLLHHRLRQIKGDGVWNWKVQPIGSFFSETWRHFCYFLSVVVVWDLPQSSACRDQLDTHTGLIPLAMVESKSIALLLTSIQTHKSQYTGLFQAWFRNSLDVFSPPRSYTVSTCKDL